MQRSHSDTDYLLSASLDSLRAESAAWISDVDFWRDKMFFL
ncbi:hypothetical protein [Fulvivirga ulvae]|nr:hypothetical protein [Fulvivirga ulvae]